MPNIEYIYVFVRTDINLEQQTVQACHACNLAGRDFQHKDDTHLILLEVDDVYELANVANICSEANIKFHEFYEPDPIPKWWTDEQEPMGFSAIATEPLTTVEQRLLFTKYPLWRSKGWLRRKLRSLLKKLLPTNS